MRESFKFQVWSVNNERNEINREAFTEEFLEALQQKWTHISNKRSLTRDSYVWYFGAIAVYRSVLVFATTLIYYRDSEDMRRGLTNVLRLLSFIYIAMQGAFSFLLSSNRVPSKSYRNLAVLRAKQKGASGGKSSKKSNTAFVSIEDTDNDLWQLEPIIEILRKGTCFWHSFWFLR